MPFDQWYDDETREAATARVLQRRATKPGDRHVFTVVAEEFGIPQQTLRAWVEEAAPETAAPARTARPKFSRVVTTHVERDEVPAAPAPEAEEAAPDEPEDVTEAPADQPVAPPAEPEEARAAPAEEVAHPVAPTPAPRTPQTPTPRTPQIAALEAEAAELRAGNAALKAALRVLTDR
ncbi:hypothetical protein [Frigoribacterium faeni]|uniref:hypothetical protein n=1 Tax=Frigoribacterium faeni TaxID=145483 RepID=UPI00141AF253|nr:hypothetical protein [Frigoribacterium faeni]NIJ05639.1 transposase-like protein [Frigoribacterium faeni]